MAAGRTPHGIQTCTWNKTFNGEKMRLLVLPMAHDYAHPFLWYTKNCHTQSPNADMNSHV